MMDSTSNIYLFGDQTNPFESDLTQIFHTKDCSLLSSFIEQVYHLLRLEISKLGTLQQKWFPRFTSIIDLLARRSDIGSNPALDSAILCLTQLASFIRYA